MASRQPSFSAWSETRPDEERWELIDGVPMMMTPPTRLRSCRLLSTNAPIDRSSVKPCAANSGTSSVGKSRLGARNEVTGPKIEFTTIPGVYEDVTDIVLNSKQLLVKLSGADAATLKIDVKRVGPILAKDIEHDHTVETMQHRSLIRRRLAAAVECRDFSLIFKRRRAGRPEIEHCPALGVDRAAERPRQVGPGQPNYEPNMTQQGADRGRRRQGFPFLLRMLQD